MQESAKAKPLENLRWLQRDKIRFLTCYCSVNENNIYYINFIIQHTSRVFSRYIMKHLKLQWIKIDFSIFLSYYPL